MDIIMPFLLITTVWGASIGHKNGLRFWLYGSMDGFGYAIWAGFGAWLMVGGGWITLVGLLMFGFGAIGLYDVTSKQVYSKLDLWVLFFGKLSFTIMTMGIIFLIVIVLGGKSSK